MAEIGNLRNLGVIDEGREFDRIVVASDVGDDAPKLIRNPLARKGATGFSNFLEESKGHFSPLGG
jgi:hypothetical protein